MSTILDSDTDIALITETLTSSDKPNSSHIVMVPDGEPDQSPQAYVLRARIEGFPVTALCGWTFTPIKDPKSLPVCTECKAIFEYDPHGFGDRDRLPDA